MKYPTYHEKDVQESNCVSWVVNFLRQARGKLNLKMPLLRKDVKTPVFSVLISKLRALYRKYFAFNSSNTSNISIPLTLGFENLWRQ